MEDGSTAEETNKGRGRVAGAVGGVGEVPAPPVGRQAKDEGEGGAIDEIRTAMEEM